MAMHFLKPQPRAAKDDLTMLKTILGKIIKPKPTGVTCIRCGWNGPREQLMKSPRLNEDGKQYQIDTCPQCLRNGGLEYHS